jgi:ABC-type lipopolysaccharide export system ATPase subunit
LTSRPRTSRPPSPSRCWKSTCTDWLSAARPVLLVEQRAKAVLAISDRAYVLGGGEVRMQGTPAELSASPEFVESFLGGRRRRVEPADG